MQHQRKLLIGLLVIFIGIIIKFRGQRSAPPPEPVIPIPHDVKETKYLAPFSNPLAPLSSDIPVVSGQYMIYLSPGHTLAAHSEAVRLNITPYIFSTFDDLYQDKVVYLGSRIGEELLEKIRADPGVELVEYDTEAWPDASVYRAPLSSCMYYFAFPPRLPFPPDLCLWRSWENGVDSLTKLT
jgi:hypothetical protein